MSAAEVSEAADGGLAREGDKVLADAAAGAIAGGVAGAGVDDLA